MKNLCRGAKQKWDFSGKFACDSEKIWVLTSPTTVQELGLETSEISLDLEIEDLIRMDYLQVESKLFFVTKTSLISYSFESSSCMNEGEMACEIIAAQWSPSQDFLAILLQNGALFLQNSELEVLKTFQLPTSPTKANISWRSDSKFFQTCSNTPKGFLIHTFDNTCELIPSPIISDTKGPVQSVCDNEELLTSCFLSWYQSQIAGTNKSNSIVFWEKNGLVHEDFKIFGTEIIKLGWNADGKILAVISDKGLELYCKMNFHWYFKYFILGVKDFEWCDEGIVCVDEGIFRTSFYFAVCEASGNVAVIDGVGVAVTMFGNGVIPPPMSHFVVKGEEPIRFVSFEGENVVIVEGKVREMPAGNILLDKQVDKAVKTNTTLFYSSNSTLFQLTNSSETTLHEYPFEIIHLKLHNSQPYVQTSDGSLYCNQTLIQKFPKPAQSLFFMKIQNKLEVFALINETLYLSNKQLTTNCTSLYCSEDFLFFTKKNAPYDVLYIFHSSDLPWTKSLPEPSSEHFYSRSIEKSSTIVSLFEFNLVLEHSRGNLETIAPRLLVLYKIKSLVLSKEYLKAFKLLRQHKIDLNLLYDIDRENFDLRLFVEQIARQDFLNLFLTSLKDQDMTCKYFLKEFQEIPAKTNTLCDQIREFLDPQTQILSVLTSFVVKNPPEIETALTWVQTLINNSPKPVTKAPHEAPATHSHSAAEDALKYLSWLISPDKLYNVALSMYDLQLTSSLAKYTQKDPKEYLPYLNTLNSMDETERKYQICIDLKNYSKALEELVKGGDAYRNKAVQLVIEQKLYFKGLELLQGKDVCVAIAEALSNSEFALQSAALYEVCEEYSRAQELYVKSEEWDLACKMAGVLKNPVFRENCSMKCAEIGRYESAARLLEGSDEELLKIKYWIQAGKYKQAAICAQSPEAKSLVKSTLRNYAEDFFLMLEKNLKIFNEKKARLDHLQQNKRMMPSGNKEMNDEVASQYSLNSMSSRVTQVSKKQRKNNAKVRKAAAKEGSVYEEDYLVDLLVSLRPDLAFFDKMEGLCYGLVVVGDFLTAKRLWEKFEEVKRTTFKDLATLRQSEFLKKFYEDFPEINRSEENDSRLKDMFAKSQFLAEGLSSHKLSVFPLGVIGRFFSSFA